jgi:hypothetical protein
MISRKERKGRKDRKSMMNEFSKVTSLPSGRGVLCELGARNIRKGLVK